MTEVLNNPGFYVSYAVVQAIVDLTIAYCWALDSKQWDALDDVWTSLFWLWLPIFDETRQLESFRTLLKESGIVELWQQKGWPEVCQPSGDTFVCDWKAYP